MTNNKLRVMVFALFALVVLAAAAGTAPTGSPQGARQRRVPAQTAHAASAAPARPQAHGAAPAQAAFSCSAEALKQLKPPELFKAAAAVRPFWDNHGFCRDAYIEAIRQPAMQAWLSTRHVGSVPGPDDSAYLFVEAYDDTYWGGVRSGTDEFGERRLRPTSRVVMFSTFRSESLVDCQRRWEPQCGPIDFSYALHGGPMWRSPMPAAERYWWVAYEVTMIASIYPGSDRLASGNFMARQRYGFHLTSVMMPESAPTAGAPPARVVGRRTTIHPRQARKNTAPRRAPRPLHLNAAARARALQLARSGSGEQQVHALLLLKSAHIPAGCQGLLARVIATPLTASVELFKLSRVVWDCDGPVARHAALRLALAPDLRTRLAGYFMLAGQRTPAADALLRRLYGQAPTSMESARILGYLGQIGSPPDRRLVLAALKNNPTWFTSFALGELDANAQDFQRGFAQTVYSDAFMYGVQTACLSPTRRRSRRLRQLYAAKAGDSGIPARLCAEPVWRHPPAPAS